MAIRCRSTGLTVSIKLFIVLEIQHSFMWIMCRVLFRVFKGGIFSFGFLRCFYLCGNELTYIQMSSRGRPLSRNQSHLHESPLQAQWSLHWIGNQSLAETPASQVWWLEEFSDERANTWSRHCAFLEATWIFIMTSLYPMQLPLFAIGCI